MHESVTIKCLSEAYCPTIHMHNGIPQRFSRSQRPSSVRACMDRLQARRQ
jgi:hypothetical protein